jgi:hypothetical protein
MPSASLKISDEMAQGVQEHLFGRGLDREQGGFLLCSTKELGAHIEFSPVEWIPLTPEDYIHHEIDYLELRDEVRGDLIKRAHDAAASVIEIHSHPWPHPAAFSPADIDGLAAFVPHMRWRLKNRPYGALVFGTTSFDGLAWLGTSTCSAPLATIVTPTGTRKATGMTKQIHGEIRHG